MQHAATAALKGDTPGLSSPDRQALFALAQAARQLPSWTRSVRAAQGGTYLSAMRGRGMEYAESRGYQPGDDVRHLDWRIMARRGDAYTKVFQEERERPVLLVVDDRAPMHFATQGVFKRVRAAEAAATLAWKACYAGDRIGGMVFDAFTHHERPPRRGKAGVTQLIHLLDQPARLGSLDAEALESSLLAGVDRVRRMVKPGALVFVLSDFRGLTETCASEFARIRQHCDLVLGHFSDPFERALPQTRARLAVHNEFGRDALDLSRAATRATYAERAQLQQETVAKLASRLRTPLLSFCTTEPPINEIRRLLTTGR